MRCDNLMMTWNHKTVSPAPSVENIVFSTDGKFIVTSGDDGTARLWDLEYHTTMKYLSSHLRDFTDTERT